MENIKTTTIQVSIETRDELMSLGRKGETYDEIIKRLITAHQKSLKEK